MHYFFSYFRKRENLKKNVINLIFVKSLLSTLVLHIFLGFLISKSYTAKTLFRVIV